MKRALYVLLFATLCLLPAPAAAQSSQAVWYVFYWNNMDQAGEPVASSREGRLDHQWGSAAPHALVQPDGWSGRWLTRLHFPAGTYHFTLTNDDGARLTLNDNPLIFDWKRHAPATNEATVSLHGGRYTLVVDFFDAVGEALLKLRWERVGPPAEGAADGFVLSSSTLDSTHSSGRFNEATWTATYWNNRTQAGLPAFSRQERSVDYAWGARSPDARIASDNWSARWTAQLYLPSGSYRFTIVGDDGMRLFVADRTLIDDWNDHPTQEHSAVIHLSGGLYPVVLDYYEGQGDAVARLWWQRIPPGETGDEAAAIITATPSLYRRLHTRPDASSPFLATIIPGTTLTVIGRTADNQWLQVYYRNYTGWVVANYTTVRGDLANVPVINR